FSSSSSSSSNSFNSLKQGRRAPGKNPNLNFDPYLLLPHYLRSHLQFISDLLTTNREMFSPIILFTMLTMFGANVSMTILSKRVTFMENSLLLLISVNTTFFLLLSVRPAVVAATVVAAASKHLLQAQNFLFSLQSSRGRSPVVSGNSSEANLRLKLNVATYYEVLISGEKFAYTVGPIGKITNVSIAQFFFFYSSYLMFSLTMSYSFV
ncbi:hypothetical protein TYRP_015312, partial [Tyrophagus putrescentiae]